MGSGPLCIFASKISRVYLKLSGLGQSRTFLWNKMSVLRWPGSKYGGESKDFISSFVFKTRQVQIRIWARLIQALCS